MSALPFHDSKPQGAADFYFAINATFRHVKERLGEEGLHEYWQALGRDYQAPVWMRWAESGLPAVAEYWRDFFAAEPGSEVEVSETPSSTVLDVRTCPAITHLRAHEREIIPEFCQHCYFMGDAAARQAGMAIRVTGGNGSCQQVCTPAGIAEPQDLAQIASCEEPR